MFFYNNIKLSEKVSIMIRYIEYFDYKQCLITFYPNFEIPKITIPIFTILIFAIPNFAILIFTIPNSEYSHLFMYSKVCIFDSTFFCEIELGIHKGYFVKKINGVKCSFYRRINTNIGFFSAAWCRCFPIETHE